jgi:hypothetical protein
MVAKIITGKNMRGAIHYNEHKVSKQQATCIHANYFPCNPQDLSISQKYIRFSKLFQHNLKAKTNTLHISLNFDPSEKLSQALLSDIANAYMAKIGFEDQPYLVYQHFDAAHPHIHILTTNIQQDGTRIDLHNIGRNQSEQARKEIETEFNLIHAQRQSTNINPPFTLPEPAIYGKAETKRALANIVNAITHSYKFTSLPELNAVLQQFNI